MSLVILIYTYIINAKVCERWILIYAQKSGHILMKCDMMVTDIQDE